MVHPGMNRPVDTAVLRRQSHPFITYLPIILFHILTEIKLGYIFLGHVTLILQSLYRATEIAWHHYRQPVQLQRPQTLSGEFM
jgi:hypothetical protein